MEHIRNLAVGTFAGAAVCGGLALAWGAVYLLFRYGWFIVPLLLLALLYAVGRGIRAEMRGANEGVLQHESVLREHEMFSRLEDELNFRSYGWDEDEVK